MNIFESSGKVEKLNREHPYSCHLNSTVNILLYFLYRASVHLKHLLLIQCFFVVVKYTT